MNEFHDPASGIESAGPFRRWPVTLNGWTVPHLEAKAHPEGDVVVTLDGRWELELPAEVAGRTIAFMADAIAVAMGYACHPRVASCDREEGKPPAPEAWPWKPLTALLPGDIEDM